MTDPERISKRSFGLAAQLLQAGGDEQPGKAGLENTLAALGVSGALLTTAVASNAAAAGGAKLSGAALAGSATAATAAGVAGSGAKVVTASVLAKWLGVGVLGGVTLSGAASLLSAPATPASAQALQISAPLPKLPPSAERPSTVALAAEVSAPAPAESAAAATASVPAPSLAAAAQSVTDDVVVEVGAPLAAEVTFIDGARALLASGRAEQGLSQLRRYEHEFPEARLLPEVLFLRMETCDRLGRSSEARVAATRLVRGFPHSPHAARARKLLEP
jgi:hypothetical protein